MKLQKITVYYLFWLVAAIIAVIGIVHPDETLDINVHDTYFVISYLHAAFVLFVFYFLSGLGYWFVQKILRKKLEKWLTIIHTVIVIGSFLLYWIVFFYNPGTEINPDFPLLYDFQSTNIVLVSEFLLTLFIATPIYIINLLIGIFRKS